MRKMAIVLLLFALLLGLASCGGKTDYYKEGQKLLDQERYEEALSMLDKALDQNGANYDAWLARGDCLYFMGHYLEAVDSYRQGLWEQVGSHPEARDAIEKALEQNPNSESLWVLKGDLLRQKSSQDDAIKCYERALEINPLSSGAWYGKYYSLDDSGDREAAEQWRIKGIQAGIF